MSPLLQPVDTPLGPLYVLSDGEGVRACGWARPPGAPAQGDPHGAALALAGYFDGDLSALDALPVRVVGTHFQRGVWAHLRTLAAGTVTHYEAIARSLGRPGGARAVGQANGANPVALIVPCHRVVAADGTVAGYAGGVDRKRWLLAHERAPGFLVP